MRKIAKRFFVVFSVILISVQLFSCSSSPSFGQSGSSVWKITKDGNTMLLGGSIHVLRKSDYPLPKQFDRAFAQSEILALEADTGQLKDENFSQYFLSRMTLPDGKTLQSILEPRTYELLAAECGRYRVSMDAVAKFKPAMVINTLTLLQMRKIGFVQEGVDNIYFEKAKSENKPVAFLETAEFQIEMLASEGEGYENEYVQYSLKEMMYIERLLEALISDWKKGSSATNEETLAEMKEQWPQTYKAQVLDRNNAWMPKLEEYLNSGKLYFVVVGLAHMHGPDGLLTQLENLGCTIERFR